MEPQVLDAGRVSLEASGTELQRHLAFLRMCRESLSAWDSVLLLLQTVHKLTDSDNRNENRQRGIGQVCATKFTLWLAGMHVSLMETQERFPLLRQERTFYSSLLMKPKKVPAAKGTWDHQNLSVGKDTMANNVPPGPAGCTLSVMTLTPCKSRETDTMLSDHTHHSLPSHKG